MDDFLAGRIHIFDLTFFSRRCFVPAKVILDTFKAAAFCDDPCRDLLKPTKLETDKAKILALEILSCSKTVQKLS